jgi:pyruvate dehydrogenase E1 component alpha subunit
VTPEDLIAFERDIADAFNAGLIRAPVHLDGGNERQLIEVFKTIDRSDWICGSWRMHAKCLLHGVPPDLLKADILAGRSITLTYPDYRIISSAIVGGILPIALGIAWWIKRGGERTRVHCFLGEMTSQSGMAWECIIYARNHELPVRWIIEDNGKSVCTDTREVWGTRDLSWECREPHSFVNEAFQVVYYRYELPWPHAGAGRRVQF